MAAKIFVDTSAFVALTMRDEARSAKAAKFLKELLEKRRTLLTTNMVLAETYNWLRRKSGHATALTFGRQVQKSAHFEIITLGKEMENEAWRIFERYTDQEFSYTDCTSFAVIQKLKLKEVFTFDKHFTVMGFTTVP